MSRSPAGRWLRQLWPQKIRTRLTVLYAGLFLVAGCVLLGVTYGLVAASLPTHPSSSVRRPLTHAQYIDLCKKPETVPVKPNPKAGASSSQAANSGKAVPPPAKLAALCRSAYLAGAAAGSDQQRQRALSSLLLFSAIGLGAMTVLSGAAGWFVSGRVLRPVKQITQTARRASEQHLGERIALTGARDELKELADTFDDMLARLDRAFSAQRRFIADASHELRTPLTVMRTAIDVTLAKPARTPEQLESMARRVRASVGRAESMIDALLTLAVSDQAARTADEPCDLATVAEDALDASGTEIAERGLHVRADLAEAGVRGSARLLERMVGNVIDNAVRHNEPGGNIVVTSGVADGEAFLCVANSGAQIPPQEIPALFEPFRRLEGRGADGNGVGLGLAIVASVAAAHSATLRASSRPSGGLEIWLRMPAAATPAASTERLPCGSERLPSSGK
jgi:signal transduction histidine kinase